MGKLSSYANVVTAAADKFPFIDVSGGVNAYVLASALLAELLADATNKLNDSNGNEYIIFSPTASAVNEVTYANAATGTSPLFSATGGDTNVSLDFAGKGTGVIRARSPLAQARTGSATADTATLTIAQLLTGVLNATPTAAAAYALPSAALAVAGVPGARVGDAIDFLIENRSGGANTITVSAGSGGTAKGTMTVAQNIVRRFTLIFTNVTGASEAYTVYGQ